MFNFNMYKNKKLTFSIESISYEEIYLIFKFKIKYKEDNSKYNLQIINRKNEKVKEVELYISEGLLVGKVNIDKFYKLIKSDIADFYIIDKNNGKKYRVKNTLSEEVGENFVYSSTIDKIVEAYSTVRGNFSIRIKKCKNEVRINSMNLSRDGKIHLSGYIFMPNINTDYEMEKINIALISDADKFYIDKDLIKYNESTLETCKISNIDCRLIDLNIDLSLLNNEEYMGRRNNIVFYIAYNNDEIMLPVNIKNIDFKNKVMINTDKYMREIDLYKSDRDYLELLIRNSNDEVDIDTVYINNNSIDIYGELCKSLRDKEIKNDLYIAIVDRSTKREYIQTIKLNDNNINIKIFIQDIIQSEIIKPGFYDIYLKYEGRMYRLISKNNNIFNKKNIIIFPEILTQDYKGEAITIKPYYTLDDHLSIEVRKYMEIRTINSVDIIDKNIRIKGILYIRKPNKDINKNLYGDIVLKVPKGKEYTFKMKLNAKLREKALVQHDFEMIINKSELKRNNVSIDFVLSNIRFDTIKCNIYNHSPKITFGMNIDPIVVKTSTEDKFKKNKFINKLIDKYSISIYNLFNKVLPINKRVIVFQSYYGKSYSCNPKAIYEQILEEKLDYKCVWILNDIYKDIPGSPIIVRQKSIKYYYYMAIAKYFVNNANFPDFYQKRANTIHIQTWHGTPLKRLGHDVSPNSMAYAENTSDELMHRIKRWDYLIAPNKYTGEILRRAYKFEKNLVEIGYPRNDIFYKENKDIKDITKSKLNIPKDKKVIMYAPTWRDYESRTGSYKLKFDLEKFKERFGDEYVLLLRLHYFDANRLDINEYSSLVYNVSFYDDIADLYLITDILITDYSSVMFDYANLNRPILFYAYDLKRYSSDIRGFYFDFLKEAPGPIVQNEERLFECIESIDKIKKNYKRRYDIFREQFCNLEDGKASKRAVQIILKNN